MVADYDATMAAAEEIHAIEIGGIPTFWSALPPPARGGLLFRCGKADERLTNSGITHLIEHLAASAVGPQPYNYNAQVDAVKTAFYAQGRPDQVASYIEEVGRALVDIPSSRLESEKNILRAEAGRSRGTWGSHLQLRYGASGPGLADYAEYGLRSLTLAQATEWSFKWFTTNNAVMWFTFDPAELAVKLPVGERIPPTEPTPLPIQWPTLAQTAKEGVGFSACGSRSWALTIGARILQRRLTERLRRQMAASYHPSVAYERVGMEAAILFAAADCSTEHSAAVVTALVEETRRLATEGPTSADLDAERSALEVAALDPAYLVGLVAGRAGHHLLLADDPYMTPLRAVEETTPAAIGDAVAKALETLLVITPRDCAVDIKGVSPYPMWSEVALTGKIWARRGTFPGGAPPAAQLISADEGLTLRIAQDKQVTVRFDEVEGLLQWPTGDRRLIAKDEPPREKWRLQEPNWRTQWASQPNQRHHGGGPRTRLK